MVALSSCFAPQVGGVVHAFLARENGLLFHQVLLEPQRTRFKMSALSDAAMGADPGSGVRVAWQSCLESSSQVSSKMLKA